MNERPQGERFTLTYVPREEPSKDSETMRFRVAKLLEKRENQELVERMNFDGGTEYTASDKSLRLAAEEELGLPFLVYPHGVPEKTWPEFFKRMSLHQCLDAITILYAAMRHHGRGVNFINNVRRIFKEENIAYEVDDMGGVHPLIDASFQSTRRAAVQGLSGDRYAATLKSVEEIDSYLLRDPENYTMAIRAAFSANENLFKLMFGGSGLYKTSQEKVSRELQRIYRDHPTMLRASNQILKSFVAWVEAAHNYRHEEGSEEPNQPEEEIAVVMISEGLSFVRWLAALDKKILAAQQPE